LFPINLFPQRVGTQTRGGEVTLGRLVSIQFVSPASGDATNQMKQELSLEGFHSICFPSEWGLTTTDWQTWQPQKFPFNLFPQRVGTIHNCRMCFMITKVSIQFVSPASGDLRD